MNIDNKNINNKNKDLNGSDINTSVDIAGITFFTYSIFPICH